MGAYLGDFRWLLWASIAAQVGLAGCGSDDGLSRYPISGAVKYDGKPLDKGMIQFFPTAMAGPAVAAGATIAGGQYAIPTAEGLVPGPYKVMISSAAGEEKAAPGESSGEGAMPGLGPLHAPELIPARYNVKSELNVTVKAEGPNEFDFDLEKTKKGANKKEMNKKK